jgi:hypothetical protein
MSGHAEEFPRELFGGRDRSSIRFWRWGLDIRNDMDSGQTQMTRRDVLGAIFKTIIYLLLRDERVMCMLFVGIIFG